MKLSSITALDVEGSLRFDARFHLSRQNPLLLQLDSSRWATTTVGEVFGRAAVWMPNRFARVWAASEEFGKPLLVPYDAFRYMPWSNSFLSRSQVAQYGQAEVTRGTILIVRSGRNCGPVTMVDSFVATFAMSDDMLRLTGLPLSDDAFYFYAFLATPTGQETIRRDRNGSVIDHLGPEQIAALRYPVVEEPLRSQVVKLFREGFEKREKARLLLAATQQAYLTHFGLDRVGASFDTDTVARRFTVMSRDLNNRLDAEPRAPRHAAWRRKIEAAGGCVLSDIATVVKPASRYKTNYVDDPRYGVAMMNGRQISQYRAIALRWMSLSAFKNPDQFRLQPGTTLLTADGRAEENLADCALVTQDRAGWGASGHVHRVVPLAGVNPGLVYLACSCAPVQAQLKALATGSVVDALSEADVASVVVPFEQSPEALQLGQAAELAWQYFADAATAEEAAIAALEAEFKGD
jgi:hypothetical protein